MIRKLLYRTVDHNGGVVFATETRAHKVARLHPALEAATIWGEFRKLMPAREYSRIVRESFDEMGEPRARSGDAFSSDQVAGVSEGDYPPWLQPEMDGLFHSEPV